MSSKEEEVKEEDKKEDKEDESEDEKKEEKDLVEEKDDEESVVQNRKQKIQQALNSFWYRAFYQHNNKSLRCTYFPATQFVEVFKTFEKGKYSVVYMTREINLSSWKRISRHRDHMLDRFDNMWIGRLPLKTKKGESSTLNPFASLRAELLLDEIRIAESSLFDDLNKRKKILKQKGRGFKLHNEIFLNQFEREKWDEIIHPKSSSQYFMTAFSRHSLWNSFSMLRNAHFNDPFQLEDALNDNVLNFALLSIPCDTLRDGSFVVHASNSTFPWSCTQARFERVYDMCVKESDAPSGLVRVDYDDLVDSLYKFTPLEADDLVEAVTRHVEKYDKAQEGIRRDAFVSLSLRCLLETTYERAKVTNNESSSSSSVATATVESLRNML
eukprot:g321.t1